MIFETVDGKIPKFLTETEMLKNCMLMNLTLSLDVSKDIPFINNHTCGMFQIVFYIFFYFFSIPQLPRSIAAPVPTFWNGLQVSNSEYNKQKSHQFEQ